MPARAMTGAGCSGGGLGAAFMVGFFGTASVVSQLEGRSFWRASDLFAFFRQFGRLDLCCGEPPCDRTAGPLLYIGLYEGGLNFDLFLREFEYAVLVDLIADVAENIGDLACGHCRSSVGFCRLLSETIIRRQQQKARHRCEHRPSDLIQMRFLRHSMPNRGLRG